MAILRKLGLSQTGPVLGFAVNVTTGLLVFTLFLVVSGNRQTMACRGRSLAHFIAAGVAENAGVFMTLVALKLGTVSVVAPISATAPIFVLPLSHAVPPGHRAVDRARGGRDGAGRARRVPDRRPVEAHRAEGESATLPWWTAGAYRRGARGGPEQADDFSRRT